LLHLKAVQQNVVQLHLLLYLKLTHCINGILSQHIQKHTKTMKNGITKADSTTYLLNPLPHLSCLVLNLCCDLPQLHHFQQNYCKLCSKIQVSLWFHHLFCHNPQQKQALLQAVTSFPVKNTKTPTLILFVDKKEEKK
jgi:hypothetical protein